MMLASCSRGESSNDEAEDVLFSIGDSRLLRSDVERMIPQGLPDEEHDRMFDAIVESNLRSMLLQEVALRNLAHPEDIKEKVNEYRNRLIISEYEKGMVEGGTQEVSEKEIQKYYNSHKSDFKLTEPLVKGIYMKTKADGYELENLKRWMSEATSASIDRIEKSGLGAADEYDYFADRWVAWHSVEDVLPDNPGSQNLRASSKVYESSKQGYTYLLRITELIEAGKLMPYEYAKRIIAEKLHRDARVDYDARLIYGLWSKAKKNGKLNIGSYDPEHLIKNKRNKNTENKIKK